MSLIERVADALEAEKQSDGHYRCRCPAHQGRSDSSLMIRQGSKHPVVVHCYADCDFRDVQKAITEKTGIEIWAKAQRVDRTTPPHTIAEYEHDTKPVKRVYRRLDNGEKKVWQSEGTTDGYHVLFWKEGRYTQEVPQAATRVYMPEGEKAAAILSERLGEWAVSFCGGTASAEKFNLERLKGLEVVYWADRDQPGQRCAKVVSKRLWEAEIKHWVLMEAGGDGADAADFDHAGLWRRVRLVQGWAAVGEEPEKDKKGKPIEREHPPLRPLVVHTGFNERIELFRHAIRQLGFLLRQNERTGEMEVSTGEDWGPMAEGWLERFLPKALGDVVQYSPASPGRKAGWGDGKLPKKDARDQMLALGHESIEQGRCDDVRTWLETLPEWDKTPRCETFLIEHYGADHTPLNCWISAAVFVQVVVRTMKPGSKWRVIPVLSGPQFSGKSDLTKQLLPQHLLKYVSEELSLSAPLKDQVEEMVGAAVVELAEMSGLTPQNMHRVKAFITKQADRTRLAYRRDSQRIERRCAFIGTKNTEDKLPFDKTGATRWGIVECPKRVDVEKVMTEDMRQQLFAEAMVLAKDVRFRGGFNHGLAHQQQAQAIEHVEEDDEMFAAVEQLASEEIEGLTLLEIAQQGDFVPYRDEDGSTISNWTQVPQGRAIQQQLAHEVAKFYVKKRAFKDGKRPMLYYLSETCGTKLKESATGDRNVDHGKHNDRGKEEIPPIINNSAIDTLSPVAPVAQTPETNGKKDAGIDEAKPCRPCSRCDGKASDGRDLCPVCWDKAQQPGQGFSTPHDFSKKAQIA